MTVFKLIERLIRHSKLLPFKADKSQAETPLHYAFKSGNLEIALWIASVVRKEMGVESYTDLINAIDNVLNTTLIT